MPTHPGLVVVTVILAVHLFLTALMPFRRRIRFLRWLKSHDRIAVLPNWMFFAPRPVNHDLVVIYRDRAPGRPFTPWADVVCFKRPTWSGVLFPQRRTMKTVRTCSKLIVKRHRRVSDLTRYPPYRYLLHLTLAADPCINGAAQRQWAIVSTHLDVIHEPAARHIVFYSPWITPGGTSAGRTA